MHWCPRHTPRIGVLGPKRRTTSVEIPASPGVQGPGERMMCEGCSVSISWRVVASYHGLLSQLAHVAGQVVDERVVVVDQEDHGTRAAMSPRALSSVSRYSCSGSESATMPPPTWTYTSRPSTRQVRITILVSNAPDSER